MQLVKAIYIEDYGWQYPCCKMWMDYPEETKLYHDIAIDEWIKRGYNNNMLLFRVKESEVTMLHWLGNEQLHMHHTVVICLQKTSVIMVVSARMSQMTYHITGAVMERMSHEQL